MPLAPSGVILGEFDFFLENNAPKKIFPLAARFGATSAATPTPTPTTTRSTSTLPAGTLVCVLCEELPRVRLAALTVSTQPAVPVANCRSTVGSLLEYTARVHYASALTSADQRPKLRSIGYIQGSPALQRAHSKLVAQNRWDVRDQFTIVQSCNHGVVGSSSGTNAAESLFHLKLAIMTEPFNFLGTNIGNVCFAEAILASLSNFTLVKNDITINSPGAYR